MWQRPRNTYGDLSGYKLTYGRKGEASIEEIRFDGEKYRFTTGFLGNPTTVNLINPHPYAFRSLTWQHLLPWQQLLSWKLCHSHNMQNEDNLHQVNFKLTKNVLPCYAVVEPNLQQN